MRPQKKTSQSVIIRGAMEHLYLVVNCKTPGCTAGCVIKHLGPYAGQSEVQKMAPEWFEFRCGECKKLHLYSRTDVYPIRNRKAPPPEFENAF